MAKTLKDLKEKDFHKTHLIISLGHGCGKQHFINSLNLKRATAEEIEKDRCKQYNYAV